MRPWRLVTTDADVVELHFDPDRVHWVADPGGWALRLGYGAALFNVRVALHGTRRLNRTPANSLERTEPAASAAHRRPGRTHHVVALPARRAAGHQTPDAWWPWPEWPQMIISFG